MVGCMSVAEQANMGTLMHLELSVKSASRRKILLFLKH